MRRRLAKAAFVLAGAAVLAGLGVRHWRLRNVSAVQRGFSVAAARGCFNCHGPGGVTGLEDPEGRTGGAPGFGHDEVAARARSDDEIREWILNGRPLRLREEEPADEEDGPLLMMPAWRGRLSEAEVDDLVAYIRAVAELERPSDERAEAGGKAALSLGCFGCHGPQGRGNPPNPGSLKGYIPSWAGDDFPELVRDDAELEEWILDGAPRRLRDHPLASFFLRRQVLKMPAYRGRVSQEELHSLRAYVRWLRRSSAARVDASSRGEPGG